MDYSKPTEKELREFWKELIQGKHVLDPHSPPQFFFNLLKELSTLKDQPLEKGERKFTPEEQERSRMFGAASRQALDFDEHDSVLDQRTAFSISEKITKQVLDDYKAELLRKIEELPEPRLTHMNTDGTTTTDLRKYGLVRKQDIALLLNEKEG